MFETPGLSWRTNRFSLEHDDAFGVGDVPKKELSFVIKGEFSNVAFVFHI